MVWGLWLSLQPQTLNPNHPQPSTLNARPQPPSTLNPKRSTLTTRMSFGLRGKRREMEAAAAATQEVRLDRVKASGCMVFDFGRMMEATRVRVWDARFGVWWFPVRASGEQGFWEGFPKIFRSLSRRYRFAFFWFLFLTVLVAGEPLVLSRG